MSVCVARHEGRADCSFKQNTRREKQLAGGRRGKTQSFWPFICSNHRIISAMEIGPIPLCPKRMCASLIEFELKIKFKKCYPAHSPMFGLLMSSDFRCWQHVQVWGNLEKQKELIKTSVPNPQAMVHCLPSCDPEQKAYSFTQQALWDTVTFLEPHGKQPDSYISRFPDDLIRSTTCLWVKPSVLTPLIFARTSPGRCQEKWVLKRLVK